MNSDWPETYLKMRAGANHVCELASLGKCPRPDVLQRQLIDHMDALGMHALTELHFVLNGSSGGGAVATSIFRRMMKAGS